MKDAMKQSPTVTPWEVKGNIDYDSLIQNFGVSRLDADIKKRIAIHAKKKNLSLHHMLQRDIFFAHRDMISILDVHDSRNSFFLYTGRAPSGHTHLGHLVPWLFTKWLQDVYDVDLWFQFPDEEKFLFKKELTLEQTQDYLKENMLDVIALGFNPKKTHFIVDTLHAGIMYPLAVKIAKHISFSMVRSSFGIENDQNIGFIFYTAMQAAPAILPSVVANKKIPCLIPHAIDQDPHFRLSRDVIPKLGYPKPASIQCRFLPGLGGMNGDGKMSSSSGDGATIYTIDTPEMVKKKINKYAFSGGQATIEEHRTLGGNPDVDIAYQWLTFFEEDDEKLVKIYHDYKSGALLSGELKKITIDKLNTLLAEHQKKREKARKLVDSYVYKLKSFDVSFNS